MKTAESHLYLPTTRDPGTNAINAVTANAVCAACHGSSITPAFLNTRETQYKAALAAFQGALNTKGICWTSGYPYFKVFNVGTNTCTSAFYTTWAGKDELGAAFNMNLFKNMPMAFVHNNLYTKRLIFDSIDFLGNGSLTGNISTIVSGLTPSYITSQQVTDALTFLNNGVRP
jgi:hypothetical protein